VKSNIHSSGLADESKVIVVFLPVFLFSIITAAGFVEV